MRVCVCVSLCARLCLYVCVCVRVRVHVCVLYVVVTVNIHRSIAPRAYGVTNKAMRLEGSTVCDPLIINNSLTVLCEITLSARLFLVTIKK